MQSFVIGESVRVTNYIPNGIAENSVVRERIDPKYFIRKGFVKGVAHVREYLLIGTQGRAFDQIGT